MMLEERSHINYLSFCLKKPVKEEQINILMFFSPHFAVEKIKFKMEINKIKFKNRKQEKISFKSKLVLGN